MIRDPVSLAWRSQVKKECKKMVETVTEDERSEWSVVSERRGGERREALMPAGKQPSGEVGSQVHHAARHSHGTLRGLCDSFQ